MNKNRVLSTFGTFSTYVSVEATNFVAVCRETLARNDNKAVGESLVKWIAN